MTDDVQRLLEANLRVFGERDAAARRTAIDEVYSADVVFTDPEGRVVGRDALDEKAGRLIEGIGGLEFALRGEVLVSGDLGYLEWDLAPAGAAPVQSGRDIAIVRDGRIAVLHTLLDPPPAAQ